MNEKRTWNAQITKASLTMESHGCLTLWLTLEDGGSGIGFGGRCLGHGFVGAKTFEGSAKGLEYIMRIMDTVGVDCFEDLKGKYVRVVDEGFGSQVKGIGHIIKNKWFIEEDFYKETK